MKTPYQLDLKRTFYGCFSGLTKRPVNFQSTLDDTCISRHKATQMNPYMNLPSKGFWKLAVANRSMFDIDELWDPKFNIKPSQRVATFGSCFAQHIGKALSARGFNWLITEKAPQECSELLAKKYNYGVFTARTGNIYTTSLLKQWVEWATEKKEIPSEIWRQDGRFYDPFRPRIEPNGFASENEVRISQSKTLKSFKESIEKSDYFIFTLGLTESWINNEHGYEYPTCPGTIAGSFNKSEHKFVNQQFQFIIKSLSDSIALMRNLNPKLKFILTVSPVPLTATNSGKHVAIATMASKSILRAVTDQLSTNRSYIDYFPSYEIINSPIFRGTFFEPNQRSVTPHGVNFVMNNFFKCLADKYRRATNIEKGTNSLTTEKSNTEDSLFQLRNEEYCEEALLEAFGEKQ